MGGGYATTHVVTPEGVEAVLAPLKCESWVCEFKGMSRGKICFRLRARGSIWAKRERTFVVYLFKESGVACLVICATFRSHSSTTFASGYRVTSG